VSGFQTLKVGHSVASKHTEQNAYYFCYFPNTLGQMRTTVIRPPTVGRAIPQCSTGVVSVRRDAPHTAQPNHSHRCKFVRCGTIAQLTCKLKLKLRRCGTQQRGVNYHNNGSSRTQQLVQQVQAKHSDTTLLSTRLVHRVLESPLVLLPCCPLSGQCHSCCGERAHM